MNKASFEDPIEYGFDKEKTINNPSQVQQYLSFSGKGQKAYGEWLKKLNYEDTPPRGKCKKYFESNAAIRTFKRKEMLGHILVSSIKEKMRKADVHFISDIR